MGLTRRNLLKAGVAGAALAGLGTKIGLRGKSVSRGAGRAEAALFGEPTFQDVYSQIGKYIHVVPGKFGGGVGA